MGSIGKASYGAGRSVRWLLVGRKTRNAAFSAAPGEGRQERQEGREREQEGASITGSLVFGGEKRGAKLGQDESSSSDALEQDETGFGCDGVYERMRNVVCRNLVAGYMPVTTHIVTKQRHTSSTSLNHGELN